MSKQTKVSSASLQQLPSTSMTPVVAVRVLGRGPVTREAKGYANRTLAACLEALVRVLPRLFVSGVLGSQARHVSTAVS